MASNKVISQKEYLKKYLSGEKTKKKKKKPVSSSSVLKRSKIIDDDIDLKNMRVLDDDEVELYQLGEDAPQIAGFVDDRPAEVQAMEYYNDRTRWKVFGNEDEDGTLTVKDNHMSTSNVIKTSNEKPEKKNASELKNTNSINKMKSSSCDMSPPRKSKNESDSDMSPPRKSQKNTDSDISPPRNRKKNKSRDYSNSPPRSRKKSRKDSSDSDLSPPRKGHGKRNYSPHRRKSRKDSSDSDLSPPRKEHGKRGNSPQQKSRKDSYDSDLSPPRKRHGKKDYSPPSRRKYQESTKSSFNKYNRDSSPHRKRRDDSDDNQKKKTHYEARNDHGNSSDSRRKSSQKMDKTLDGKQAGLQDAKQLRRELQEFKEKEDNVFSKLSAEMSGKGAATVIRDRATGKKRDFEKEREIELEKAQKAAIQNEKYEKWGRGLKQIEDAAQKFADAAHEMSKPLARYAGDSDLDNYLKAQEREGDPMLDYIRRKQKESISLTESKPTYQGSFMPNRFGIRPGYRWDGVDRSSGFEKQWFTTQNSKKARDEEAYKWSTSDM